MNCQVHGYCIDRIKFNDIIDTCLQSNWKYKIVIKTDEMRGAKHLENKKNGMLADNFQCFGTRAPHRQLQPHADY